MLKAISIISNQINPLQIKENKINDFWFDVLQNLYYINNNNSVKFRSRLNILNFNLTSRDILNIKEINEDEYRGLESFALFLLIKIKKEDYEIPIIHDLLFLIAFDFEKYKKEIRDFVSNDYENIYKHNYYVCNERIVLFLNRLFTLFSLNIYKANKNKTNIEVFNEYKEFIKTYEFEKDKYKFN